MVESWMRMQILKYSHESTQWQKGTFSKKNLKRETQPTYSMYEVAVRWIKINYVIDMKKSW